jgi:hypothetical protein
MTADLIILMKTKSMWKTFIKSVLTRATRHNNPEDTILHLSSTTSIPILEENIFRKQCGMGINTVTLLIL